MQEVNEAVLGIMAGTIEKLLQEEQEGIANAFNTITEGIAVSIKVALKKSDDGVEANYTVSYPLEPKPEAAAKQTVKKRDIININQSTLELEV